MVIGKGMIAQKFNKYDADNNFMIFASGVSDSTTTGSAPFLREYNLLKNAITKNTEKKLVYFSTCGIYDPSMRQSPYILHKLKMEEAITKNAKNYIIFRVSNPIGKTNNTHTVLNFFIQHILEKKQFTVWKYASRNLLDIDDMFSVCDYILENHLFKNSIVNIGNRTNYPITTIIETLENHFNTKGIYTIVEKGNSPLIDITAIEPLISKLNINFDDQYLLKILQKHFSL